MGPTTYAWIVAAAFFFGVLAIAVLLGLLYSSRAERRMQVAGRAAAVIGDVSAGDRPAGARRDSRVVLAARPADRRDLGAEIRERIAGIRQTVFGPPQIMRLLVRGAPKLEPQVAVAREYKGHDRGDRPPEADKNALCPLPRLEWRVVEHARIEGPHQAHQRTALVRLPSPPAR